jgi:hypothetical protein
MNIASILITFFCFKSQQSVKCMHNMFAIWQVNVNKDNETDWNYKRKALRIYMLPFAKNLLKTQDI